MSIVVENGTGVTGANSYASISEFNTYLKTKGTDPVIDNTDKVKALTSGTLYVDKKESLFLGAKVNPFQALSFPRKDIKVDDVELASDSIPYAVKAACMEAAYIALTDNPIAHSDGKKLIRERIEGVIDQQYDVSSSSFKAPSVDVLLSPVLRKPSFRVVRA